MYCFTLKNHIFFLFLIITSSSILEATNYYVALSGNNINSGKLIFPFQIIQFAYSKAVACDNIYLRAGTYREIISLVGKTGSFNKPITLSTYNGENAIISGFDVKTLS